MLVALVQWLDRVGPLVFWACIVGALAIDTVAAATVLGTRSRALVNKWTGAVLVANATLLGVGVAVPSAMYVAKMAVMAVAPSMTPNGAVLSLDEP
jgi:hypothetical protein